LIQEDNDTSNKLVLSANGSAATQVFRVWLNVDFRFSIKTLNFQWWTLFGPGTQFEPGE
jgi:hypothetical protein